MLNPTIYDSFSQTSDYNGSEHECQKGTFVTISVRLQILMIVSMQLTTVTFNDNNFLRFQQNL